MEWIQVIGTSIFSVVALFLLSKLIGNKQISQLSLFDYIIGISIGSIAAEMATELEKPLHSLLAMVVYALIAFGVSVMTEKSTHMRKRIIGKPLILLHNGQLYRDNFKKAHIDLSDFLTHCRNQGYFDLSQIHTAVFEYNGSLSILPVERNRPLTPSDLKLQPEQQALLVNVILDGNVNESNLKHAGYNRVWLEKQLRQQGYRNPADIFLASVDTVNRNLQIYPMQPQANSSDPFD